ncbi:hypothetical protein PSU4_56960 [Pseudonocardia sulfidoxydans NBRC 16205]|uniref:PRC-barrel domain-containing protein n=1 Tax=Pseudonocardia sulfidoxydans NBRC 16205 TaxID=1223511 RepID=A0A511DPJ6_9PSEU|nr:hypothetical protein [Pseudonocardia sulfidoxydans]GEL26742.1 hypothetical protein PSU4_56960 [Pseudonocardia sulfidoxydans NBRC 16205]
MTTTPHETPRDARHRAAPVAEEPAASPTPDRPARHAQPDPTGGSTPPADDWTGRTVHGRDGAKLGTLTRIHPAGEHSPVPWGVVKGRIGAGRLVPLDRAQPHGDQGVVVPVDKAGFRTAPTAGNGGPDAHTLADLDRHYAGRGALAVARERQHERFGGVKIGAAFFGWIVAVGLTVILFAIAAGIAAATGFSLDLSGSPTEPAPETVGLTAAIAIVVVMALAYLGGGYVAGRLARFDGARNGSGTWVIGLVVTIAAGIAGAVLGAEYDVMERVVLPSIALPTGALTIGGVILLVVVAIVTLLAAVLGGRAGERYHRRVDKAGAIA